MDDSDAPPPAQKLNSPTLPQQHAPCRALRVPSSSAGEQRCRAAAAAAHLDPRCGVRRQFYDARLAYEQAPALPAVLSPGTGTRPPAVYSSGRVLARCCRLPFLYRQAPKLEFRRLADSDAVRRKSSARAGRRLRPPPAPRSPALARSSNVKLIRCRCASSSASHHRARVFFLPSSVPTAVRFLLDGCCWHGSGAGAASKSFSRCLR